MRTENATAGIRKSRQCHRVISGEWKTAKTNTYTHAYKQRRKNCVKRCLWILNEIGCHFSWWCALLYSIDKLCCVFLQLKFDVAVAHCVWLWHFHINISKHKTALNFNWSTYTADFNMIQCFCQCHIVQSFIVSSGIQFQFTWISSETPDT